MLTFCQSPNFKSIASVLLLVLSAGLLNACSSSTSSGGGGNPSPLTIATASLANGQAGAAYSATLTAGGGTPPYTWSVLSGSLPAGLMLNSATGAITGTPTQAANNTAITFKLTDSGSPVQTKMASLTITIIPATLAIATTSLSNGQVGTPYNAALAATGGTLPFTWSITSGSLPGGLSLNTSSGAISGTPSVAVTNSALTFQVQDAGTPQQVKTVSLSLTIAPSTLSISTTSLPSGQVNIAYNATLTATGGTAPYSWSLLSGTLPSGLMLNTATGAITGTPTVAVSSTPLMFQVQDNGSPQQTKSGNFTLTIANPGAISVSISPKRTALTVSQQLKTLNATVMNDSLNQGVTWSISPSVSGNPFNPSSSASGAAVTFTAPTAAGVYTITAKSVSDATKSATITVGVTDLTGVTTYHNNNSRDGSNPKEYALTPATVSSSTFGKLFSCPIDAPAYAQPLWVANLNINGATHNVVFVATVHNTVYAFDGDASPCVQFWSVSLLGAGETYVNFGDLNTDDIYPDIGIIGTPVIDLASATLYVVSKSKDTGTTCTPAASCHQRLHALGLINGSEKFNGPANIDTSITVSGTGDGSSGGILAFNPHTENQRPGLILLNGVVYIAWASHGDNDPYHGWVVGYPANNLSAAPVGVWNSTPNLVAGSPSRGGIWMGGGAPAADTGGFLYFLTGNGSFDANTGGSNYGDSTIKLSTASGLSLADYFTPMNQDNLNSGDADHGSGGAAILIDQPSGPVKHLLIGGGKAGVLFLVNRDNLGGFNSTSDNVVQSLSVGPGLFGTCAFWNNWIYIAGAGANLEQFPFNTTTGLFGTPSSSSNTFGFPGATPSVSASGPSTNGVVWALDNTAYGRPCCANGPAVLHAYDATNIGTELWNSAQVAANAAGNAVKFTVPTVANGKVYVGTRAELSVYGLLPN